MDDYTGKVIKSYELKERIGEGGFGAVYRAHQQLIGREVAVKIILPQYANRPDFIRRFETEAQLVARLEHPHIVPLYDYWREPTGAYLVMRWLRGGSVQDYLNKEGPLPPKRVSQILDQIAEALAVAHRQGVVHRDLKPENLMLDENGNTYLSDFGIAKDLVNEANITQKNAIVGSPAYLSPEQIRGDAVTAKSDIYALGLVLYQMLTGQRPFPDNSPATLMYKHLSEQIPDVSLVMTDLPSAVDAVLQRATSKDPDLRYSDTIDLAREFRRAVRSFGTGELHERNTDETVVITSTGIMLPEPENPYKGLRAFQQADAADFFGRAALIENILARMSENDPRSHFLAVVGPSGSGKSSVVKAGVIPAIRSGALPGSQNWFVVEMVPGIDPLEELEAALLRIAVNPPESLLKQLKEDERGLLRAIKRVLPDDDTELVLMIDQFEELFTLVDDEDDRAHFLDSLIVAAVEPRSRIRIIITLRADFYDRPLNYNRFGELMRQRTEIVLPLTPHEIEEAIRGPADRVGLHLENGLLQAIVADVSEQPGTLPLLQYALTELFERRDGHTLTKAGYEDIGGTMGALGRRADELYAGLGDDGQEAARQLFLRLVTLGEGTEDTRRRAFQTDLLSIGEDPDSMAMVIDAFGRYRLLTFDHDSETRTATVEVAHEALIRQWARLRSWLNDSREDLRMQRRLGSASDEWVASNRDPSFLARGARLEQFESWSQTTTLALSTSEHAYLEASIAAREAMLAAEKARQEREEALERRSRNQLRILVAVMTIAAVVGFILAIFAFSQRREAENARAEAETNAEIAQENAAEARSLALAANARNALVEHDPTLGLRLSIEANDSLPTSSVEVLRTLATLAYGPGVRFRLTGHEGAVLTTDISHDGQLGVSGSVEGSVRLWNIETGEAVREITLPDVVIMSVAFSPDDETVLVGGSDATAYLFEVATGEEIRQFQGHTDYVTSVAFTSDGARAVTGSLDRTMRLWDMNTGEALQVYEGHVGAILSIAISPDDTLIASSSGDATILDDPNDEVERVIRVWDLESGEQTIDPIVPPTGFIRTVEFSPDSTRIVTGSWNSAESGVLTLWDAQTGQEIRRFYGHTDIISRVIFTPDGTHLLSGSWDRTIRLWNLATGVEEDQFAVFHDRVLDLDISPNSQYVLVGSGNAGNNLITSQTERSADTSVWLVDLESRAVIQEYTGHEDWVWSMDVSPDGTQAVSGAGALRGESPDNTVRLWDISTGEVLRVFEGHTGTVEGLAFHPSSEQILSGGWDQQVILWDVETGEEIRRFGTGDTSHEGQVFAVAFSPDGALAASGDSNGVIILWDVETGEEIRRFEGHTAAVPGLAFSPDGTQLASAGRDNIAILWDVEMGEEIRRFEGHTSRLNDLAFTSDGAQLLTGAWDTTLRLWDVATGEEIRQFVGHTGAVQGVAISPDDQLVLSGAGDTTLRLWDMATGEEMFRYDGHQDWISEVAFVEPGYALSSAQDNTLRLWQVPSDPQAVVEWAQNNRYIVELSDAQRARYRIEG
ncbi:MAG: hypothetical protein OHK0046_06820 [Anaerolineae bacterium]